MTRLARVVLSLLAALSIALGAASAVTASPSTEAFGSASYHYDAPASGEVSTDAAGERGPPITHDRDAYPTVDRWSRHASARSGGAAPATTTDYDTHPVLVEVASFTRTTRERVLGADGKSVVFDRAAVAANTAARACSFSGATTVLMADGTRKPIKDVKVGDKVIATDPETGEQIAKTVEHVFVHDDTVIDLVVEGEVITTTEDHPFWSVTDQRFERADELSRGEKVLSADGRVITVSGLELGTAREALAYNLSVEGIHTYHVGDDAILVHNTCLTALRGWSSARFQFGNAQFQLDKSGMSHILQRHHPSYWDGSVKASQTFFDKSMSIADVESAIGVVARGNRAGLIRIGAGTGQVQGSVNGVNFVLGVFGGRIGQFYPGTLP